MRVIPPLDITDAMLTSSTAAEPSTGETAWNAATSYTVGQQVIRSTTHRIYENLVAGVDASYPENATSGATPRWLDVGPTNKWAMFDTLRNSATTKASPLTVVITPGERVNSIAIVGTNAESATVTVSSGGTTVFTRTENLITRETTSWYSYFFGTFATRPSVVFYDLPPYMNEVITVTLSRASDDVICGGLILGNHVYIGSVEYNAVSDVLNFSTVERDIWGNAIMTPRRNVPKTNQTLWVEKEKINSIRKLRASLDAKTAIWSGMDDSTESDFFESLLILGYYRTFSISLDYPNHAKISLELEEV